MNEALIYISSRKKLPDVSTPLNHEEKIISTVNRNISAFAHIPEKELYIFPSSMCIICFQIMIASSLGKPHRKMTPHFLKALKDWLITPSRSPSQRWCLPNSMEVPSRSSILAPLRSRRALPPQRSLLNLVRSGEYA